MRIRIVAFATAAQALGSGASELELPDGATAGDLLARLESAHPALRDRRESLALAVDGELVRSETRLTPGCEVAILPPVSGG